MWVFMMSALVALFLLAAQALDKWVTVNELKVQSLELRLELSKRDCPSAANGEEN